MKHLIFLQFSGVRNGKRKGSTVTRALSFAAESGSLSLNCIPCLIDCSSGPLQPCAKSNPDRPDPLPPSLCPLKLTF